MRRRGDDALRRPLLGVLLILGTDAPFWFVNVVAGVVYALTMPFVALVTAYVYFDASANRARRGTDASCATCRDKPVGLTRACRTTGPAIPTVCV